MCAQHVSGLGGESPLRALRRELLAEDKGVRREAESEGSPRQNPEPTNRNRIQGEDARTRPLIRPKSHTVQTHLRKCGGCMG